MRNIIARFIRDEQGQDLIEYALLGSFVSLAAYTGATALADGYNSWFKDIGKVVEDAGTKAKEQIK